MVETHKVAYVFPGQGAQMVGMGKNLYETCDSARAIFQQADKALGFAISNLCFNGPEDQLLQTVNSATGLSLASVLQHSGLRSKLVGDKTSGTIVCCRS